MNTETGLTASSDHSARAIAEENARFMSKVYMWMTAGIALSGYIAYAIGTDEKYLYWLLSNRGAFQILILLQFAAVIGLVALIKRMGALLATAIYLLYTALTGTTLSVIFMVYARDSIFHVFGMTAFAFAGLSGFGYLTKRDLGPVGSFCVMGLWGLVGFGIASMFFPGLMTTQASQVYAIVGIIVFSGLTAYDTQKIKRMNVIGNEGTEEDQKEAIFGALTLYLDFINLFLSILRLVGRRK